MHRTFLILGFVALAAVPSAQGPVVAPTPNLVADGIPPIPASLADDVRRYTESRPANLADWHPTRREMLISTRFGNARAGPPGEDARRRAHAADLLQTSRSRAPVTSRARAATSSSARTSAATSSGSSTATTSPTAASRCSPTAAARRTAAASGATRAIAWPTPRRAATAPTATSTSWIRRIRRPTGWCCR